MTIDVVVNGKAVRRYLAKNHKEVQKIIDGLSKLDVYAEEKAVYRVEKEKSAPQVLAYESDADDDWVKYPVF